MANEVTDTNFEEKVLKSDKPVLVDFWAEWCGPCMQLAPHIDALSDEMHEKIYVYKMNVDQNTDTPSKFGLKGIPTLMIFKNGQLAATKVGALPKSALFDWVNDNI